MICPTCTTCDQHDLELRCARDGYPALAAWMGHDPDGDALVFRKFCRLGARNLLHLQNKLINLESDIDKLDEEARRSSNLDSRQASRQWERLMELAQNGSDLEKRRLEKAESLITEMKKYRKALLLEAQIANLNRPSNRILTACRDYVAGVAGKSIPIVTGSAKTMFEDENDVVALRKPAHEDFLSKLLQDHWPFQKRAENDPLGHTTVYKGNHVVLTVAAISMVCAAALLAVAIVSLYIVSSPTAKLGMVVAYTVIFALSSALLTNARRAEIFGAAAAYAAVLVVFISGNVGGSQSEQCLMQLGNGLFKIVTCPS